MLGYSEAVAVTDEDRRAFLEFAVAIAGEAGESTLGFFRQAVQVENKLIDSGGFDPVTEADRGAERIIRKAIAARFPEHGICGEEYGLKEGNGLTWVVDPIDGTRAFMSGMLHWGVLLALFDGQEPIIGVMHQPFTNEYFYGDGNVAKYRRGNVHHALRVRACGSLDAAVLAATGPQLFAPGDQRAAFDRLSESALLTRFGGDCYLYGMLAMGFVDVAAEAGMNPYDIQALVPIIRGAGGTVTTWTGSDPSMGGAILATGDPLVHKQALEILG
jgi:myo-inositol-1(or 4)-monophosphatase